MAFLNRDNLLFYLVVVISLCHSTPCVSGQGIPTAKQHCSFPGFLQELCVKSSNKDCRHWSQGERHPHDMYRSNSEVRGEYKWVFNGGKVEIFGDSHSSRTTSVFYCWQKLAPHIFIIFSNNTTNENDSNVKYSCVKFRRRGRNVIEYEQSPWKNNYTRLVCNASDLIINESPLILTVLKEIPDCPADLRGGFQIKEVNNELTGKQCLSNNDTVLGTFESDCMGKEGLLIHLETQENCLMSTAQQGSPVGFHLALSCYSKPWRDGKFTYFIAKRRALTRSAFTFLTSDFFCVKFRKVTNEDSENFALQIHDQPICLRSASAKTKSLTMHLRRRTNVVQTEGPLSEISKTECSFSEKFRGIWKELSVHNGARNVDINETTVNIPPYGHFYCKQQYIFQHQAPYKCSSLVTGKWPETGRAKFFIDDYLLLSNFTNGCRPRLTRFGVTDIVGSDVLVYRLSQSQPIIIDGHDNNSLEYYYFNHVLRLFCSSWLPYTRDPYPLWGRNIDKILIKRTSVSRTAHCFLPSRGKGVYHFKSVNRDQQECIGPMSRVQFACKNSFSFEVKYDPSCQKRDVSFSCIGLAWKIGEFFLVQDVKTKNISCMWFDEPSNQMFLLNSPQCSDVDWGPGNGPQKEVNFAEKFIFQYYSKCPVTSDTRERDYPIVIKRRNVSRNFHLTSHLIVLACLVISITC